MPQALGYCRERRGCLGHERRGQVCAQRSQGRVGEGVCAEEPPQKPERLLLPPQRAWSGYLDGRLDGGGDPALCGGGKTVRVRGQMGPLRELHPSPRRVSVQLRVPAHRHPSRVAEGQPFQTLERWRGCFHGRRRRTRGHGRQRRLMYRNVDSSTTQHKTLLYYSRDCVGRDGDNFARVVFEPLQRLLVRLEPGRDGAPHHLVVLVEPRGLGVGEELVVEKLSLDRNVREAVEPEESGSAKVVSRLFLAHHEQVLNPDSKGAGFVVAGFVGDNHTGEQRGDVVEAHGDGLRALVDVERGADAVPRPVAVVESRAPERLPREAVDDESGSSLGEDGLREGDVAFEHAREAFLLVRRRLPKVDRPRRVRGPAVKLRAGVEQNHAVRADGARVARTVVDDGAVRAFPEDGLERDVEEAGLGLAERVEFLRRGSLGRARPALFHLRLEPRPEAGHDYGVAQVRLAHPRELRLVLERLGLDHGGGALDEGARGGGRGHRLRRGSARARALRLPRALLRLRLLRAQLRASLRRLRDEEIRLIRVDPHRFPEARKLSHVRRELVVLLHLHPSRRQSLQHRGWHLRFAAVQRRRLFRHHCIAHDHGTGWDVRASDVEEPRNLVEHTRNEHPGAILCHLLAHATELLLHRHARVIYRVQAHGIRRERRSPLALPHRIHGVRLAIEEAQFDTTLGELVAQRACIARAVHARVDAHTVPRLQLRQNHLYPFRSSRQALLHQFPLGPELILRLQKVAPIRPEHRLVLQHQSQPRRAREAAHKTSSLETLRRHFAVVGVLARHDERLDATSRTRFTESAQPLVAGRSALGGSTRRSRGRTAPSCHGTPDRPCNR
mmetsp:Transcript_30765/g.100137  ORF Transcript_30765/g.100137 Transcript_30765/m.100137 type:complete len:841 (-) Transcript_30765:117-2639(-)